MSAKPENDRERIARMIERLRAPMVLCPFDPKSPKYLQTDPDKPCEFCGQENTLEGPDLCRGGDLRVMEDAAKLLEAIAQRETGAPVVKPVKDEDIPALLRVAIRRLEAYDAPSRPAMLDLASHLRGVLEIPHDAEQAVRQCASLDTNGYIAEKAAIIGALRASAINPPAEAHARIEAMEEALREARDWHASRDKSLSKQPPSADHSWRRLEHQEERDRIDALLSGSKPAGETVPADLVREYLNADAAYREGTGGYGSKKPPPHSDPKTRRLMAASAALTAALTTASAKDGETY